MMDLPEVRQILRDNLLEGETQIRTMNHRGQFPEQLRHQIKAEDSSEDTEDEFLYQS